MLHAGLIVPSSPTLARLRLALGVLQVRIHSPERPDRGHTTGGGVFKHGLPSKFSLRLTKLHIECEILWVITE